MGTNHGSRKNMLRPPPFFIALTFAAAFTCYLDRVGFPIVYTTLARDTSTPKTIQGSVHMLERRWDFGRQVNGNEAALEDKHP